MKTTQTEIYWVYRLKDGFYYKEYRKGSWSLESFTYKKYTTSNLLLAYKTEEPLETPPYLHPRLLNGEWVQIRINTTAEVIN